MARLEPSVSGMQNSAASRVTRSGTKNGRQLALGDATLVVEHDLPRIGQDRAALDAVGEAPAAAAGADRDRAQMIGRQGEALREVRHRRGRHRASRRAWARVNDQGCTLSSASRVIG